MNGSASGRATLDDRLLPAEPLARPSETDRLHVSETVALDLLIEPHDAVLGEGTR